MMNKSNFCKAYNLLSAGFQEVIFTIDEDVFSAAKKVIFLCPCIKKRGGGSKGKLEKI